MKGRRRVKHGYLSLAEWVCMLTLLVWCGVASAQSCSGSCDSADKAFCLADGGLWHDYPYCSCDYKTPIIISRSDNHLQLTTFADGTRFDLDADGIAEQTAWVSADSDDVFLVLDRDGNGRIDNGKELFGGSTEQPISKNRNGFLALSVFDRPENGGNGDGYIDALDLVFTALRVWQDRNHNGVSEPAELLTLPEAGIYSISLKFEIVGQSDPYGNRLRYRAKINEGRKNSISKWAYDVILASN